MSSKHPIAKSKKNIEGIVKSSKQNQEIKINYDFDVTNLSDKQQSLKYFDEQNLSPQQIEIELVETSELKESHKTEEKSITKSSKQLNNIKESISTENSENNLKDLPQNIKITSNMANKVLNDSKEEKKTASKLLIDSTKSDSKLITKETAPTTFINHNIDSELSPLVQLNETEITKHSQELHISKDATLLDKNSPSVKRKKTKAELKLESSSFEDQAKLNKKTNLKKLLKSKPVEKSSKKKLDFKDKTLTESKLIGSNSNESDQNYSAKDTHNSAADKLISSTDKHNSMEDKLNLAAETSNSANKNSLATDKHNSYLVPTKTDKDIAPDKSIKSIPTIEKVSKKKTLNNTPYEQKIAINQLEHIEQNTTKKHKSNKHSETTTSKSSYNNKNSSSKTKEAKLNKKELFLVSEEELLAKELKKSKYKKSNKDSDKKKDTKNGSSDIKKNIETVEVVKSNTKVSSISLAKRSQSSEVKASPSVPAVPASSSSKNDKEPTAYSILSECYLPKQMKYNESLSLQASIKAFKDAAAEKARLDAEIAEAKKVAEEAAKQVKIGKFVISFISQ